MTKIKIFDLKNSKADIIFTETTKGIYKLLMLPGNKDITLTAKRITI
jgi:hypothetical protein